MFPMLLRMRVSSSRATRMPYKISSSAELPLREAYPFAAAHGLATEVGHIARVEPPGRVHQSVYRRALLADLFKRNSLLDEFVTECWPRGATETGQDRLRRYERVLNRTPTQERSTLCSRHTGPAGSPLPHIEGTRLGIVALVRGMAIYKARRVEKATQEGLLRQHLPGTVTFLGAFDKSGNYALRSTLSMPELADVLVGALAHHRNLSNLNPADIALIRAKALQNGLADLYARVREQYGEAFDDRSFGVRIAGRVWRVGLSVVPEVGSLSPFDWPSRDLATVKVLGAVGNLVQFLKLENRPSERRITFGDPTRAIEEALARCTGHPVGATSRSGRAIQGVLRCFSSASEAPR